MLEHLHIRLARKLPRRAKWWIRDKVDSVLLARQKPKSVDYTRLLQRNQVSITNIFTDADIDRQWDLAKGCISSIVKSWVKHCIAAGNQRALYYLIQHFQIQSALEIGTHVGASTIHIAAAMPKSSNARRRLTTVDIVDVNNMSGPWAALGMQRCPRQNIEILDAGNVEFVTQDSTVFLKSTDDRFDFALIDGPLSAARIYEDIQLLQRVLLPGAVVVLHNYYPEGRRLWPNVPVHPGAWRAVQRLRSEGAPIEAIPLGVLPWPVKKVGPNINVTSLALLVRT